MSVANGIPSLDFELTAGCDHRCGHCYNVWGADADDPQGDYTPGPRLGTDALTALMTRAVQQTRCHHLTLTGGEPLLHRDAMALVAHASSLVDTVTLVTNGSHVAAHANALGSLGNVDVQLTLLSDTREHHDALKGAACFDDTVRAALALQDHGVPVTCCFVAMHDNADRFEAVLDLCAALGVRTVSYNRMSPTGGAVHRVASKMPSVAQIEANLAIAERVGPALGIRVVTAMPIPPCLIPHERYPSVRFGHCSTGTDAPNLTVDVAGNVRSCNLSSGVLGNLATQEWAEIREHAYLRSFRQRIPDMCRGCRHEQSCNGGCKESAFATFGDHTHPEPLLWMALRRDRAPETVRTVRLDAPVAPALGFHVLAHLADDGDVAGLHDPGLRAPWVDELQRHWDRCSSRNQLQWCLLRHRTVDALLGQLRRDPGDALRTRQGASLCSLFADIVAHERAAFEAHWSDAPAILRDRQHVCALLAPLLSRLGTRRLPVTIVHVPALGRRARATDTIGGRVVATSLASPDDHLVLQVLHEEMHAVTDPLVLRSSDLARSTRAHEPGWALHQVLEETAVDATLAFLDARAPEWLPAFERWSAGARRVA